MLNQHTEIIEKIKRILTEQISETLYYHNFDHTLDVYQAAINLGKACGLTDHELDIVGIAALFHDTGYVIQVEKNEPIGVDIARNVLLDYPINSKDFEIIEQLILATAVPQRPKSHLQEVLCDADLDYLGREDFWTISDRLFREYKAHDLVDNLHEWDHMQVSFLQAHRYFTTEARRLRNQLKQKNLESIQSRLKDRDFYLS